MAPNAIISRRRDFFRLVYVYLVLLETSAVRTVIASPSGAASPLTFAGSAHASCASHISTPVYIPIRNVSLSDQTLRRGAAISVGTPSRPFAFALSGEFNNTYLQDVATSSCDVNDTRLQCSNQFGGLFDEGSSTTWSSTNYTSLNTAAECCAGQIDDLWGSDTIVVNTTLSLSKFPLGIVRGRQDPMNTLGLGLNSTLLSALLSTGAIASKTFGIFQGWTGAQRQHQSDGGLTIGGYDAAKVVGDNFTLPLAQQDDCSSDLVISVTDMKLNLENGSNVSILAESQGSAMKACIQPNFSPMTLSQDIWGAFSNITGQVETGRSVSPLNYWAMKVPADGAYDGNLTVSIYPGLDITIPNHQLVVPNVEINPNGQAAVMNSSEVVVLINSLQDVNKNNIPRFGTPFLSSAYLIVDNDHKQFTLWKSQQSQKSNLIPIGPPACTTPVLTPTPPPSTSPLASPSSNPHSSHSGLSKGAIAGATVGGIAAVAICLCALSLLKSRRRRHLQEETRQREEKARTDAMKTDVSTTNAAHWKPEMPSDKQPPQEMPLGRIGGDRLELYEVHNEETHEMSATPRLRS